MSYDFTMSSENQSMGLVKAWIESKVKHTLLRLMYDFHSSAFSLCSVQ